MAKWPKPRLRNNGRGGLPPNQRQRPAMEESREAAPGPKRAMSGRFLALRVLQAVDTGKVRQVEDGLQVFGKEADARERGFARELALGCLQWQSFYDDVVGKYLDRPLTEHAVRWCFRLLCHQLYCMDRVPPSAALNETVGLLHGRLERYRGVVNAIGRKLVALRLDTAPERDGLTPIPHQRLEKINWPGGLSAQYGIPKEFLLACDEDYVKELGVSLSRRPPLCTRWLAESGPDEELQKAGGLLRQEGQWCWWTQTGPVLKAVAAGQAVVQDRSQGRLLELLNDHKPGRVCDMCAAPGGKSRWLIAHGWQVFSGDVNPTKKTLLRENTQGAVGLLVQDGQHPALARASMDLVLIDAPCSNSGVWGRRPEAKLRHNDTELQSLDHLQKDLLLAGQELVREGGMLMYSTCSLLPRENQERIAWLQQQGWHVIEELLVKPDGWQAGGYAALLKR